MSTQLSDNEEYKPSHARRGLITNHIKEKCSWPQDDIEHADAWMKLLQQTIFVIISLQKMNGCFDQQVATYSLVITIISHEMCMIFLNVLPLCISRLNCYSTLSHRGNHVTSLHCNSVIDDQHVHQP